MQHVGCYAGQMGVLLNAEYKRLKLNENYISTSMPEASGKLTEMFPDMLDIRSLPDGRRLILHSFDCIDKSLGLYFRVPAGFVCDLASVPGFAAPLFPKIGNHDKAAVGHDYLYVAQIYERKRADQFFLNAMIDQDVELWRRRGMYVAVRAGGWKAWNKHRR